jgi:hypothetical protein
MDKFIARDERKNKQSGKCLERRKGPGSKIKVDPTNIKGYKWNFDQEGRDKNFGEEEVSEALEQVGKMQLNLNGLIPTDKIKVLYDKWIIVQKGQNVKSNEAMRKIQDEAISQAYLVRDFETM